MAIHLDVEPYCHKCGHFEADVETNTLYGYTGTDYVDTRIRCRNREICSALAAYIREQIREEG